MTTIQWLRLIHANLRDPLVHGAELRADLPRWRASLVRLLELWKAEDPAPDRARALTLLEHRLSLLNAEMKQINQATDLRLREAAARKRAVRAASREVLSAFSHLDWAQGVSL